MRRVLRAAKAVVVVAEAAAVFVSLYQSTVMLLGPAAPGRKPRAAAASRPRFAIVVCARDEEPVVAGLLRGLKAQEYPRELYDIVLVAHNCTDRTAEVGRQEGVRVIEWTTERSGKAEAMGAALRELHEQYDYVGIFDADSRVPATLLEVVATVAAGEAAVQVETVPQQSEDWLASGYGLGRRARNVFWWRPRERLGLGTTVSGSGYFLRTQHLRELLSGLHTITEDLELTARLAARGHRVRYLSETFVQVEEPGGLKGTVDQRTRWVRGHLGVVRHYLPALLRRGARGEWAAIDFAIYLVMPSRVLTRTAVSGAFLLSLAGAPGLPGALLKIAMLGEWVLPAIVAVRERLVPLSLGGFQAAARHGLLNLLWFPIGLWALITAGSRAWQPIPRLPQEGVTDAPLANGQPA